MAKRDYELRPNRSHLVGLVWREGMSERYAYGRMPQAITQNQIDYLNFLMKKLDDAGIPYPKPNMEALCQPFGKITISPNKKLVAKKKIAYLQLICKKNGVDTSEWERHKPPKEVYKPYSAKPIALKKLSVRKG